MRRFALSSAVVLCATVVFGGHGYAQVSGRGGRGRGLAVGQPAPAINPAYYMGCVGGGNLQPGEQPFVLEPSEPFVLVDVVTRTNTTAFAPTNYRVTGINLTPWLGMRVKVEGTVVPPAPRDAAGSSGGKTLPEIKAVRVTSIWGTCPSPPAWTPAAGESKR